MISEPLSIDTRRGLARFNVTGLGDRKFQKLTAKDAKSAKENTATNHDGTTNTKEDKDERENTNLR
jgi:hypothetical protein